MKASFDPDRTGRKQIQRLQHRKKQEFIMKNPHLIQRTLAFARRVKECLQAKDVPATVPRGKTWPCGWQLGLRVMLLSSLMANGFYVFSQTEPCVPSFSQLKSFGYADKAGVFPERWLVEGSGGVLYGVASWSAGFSPLTPYALVPTQDGHYIYKAFGPIFDHYAGGAYRSEERRVGK